PPLRTVAGPRRWDCTMPSSTDDEKGKIVNLLTAAKLDADAHARADSERARQLFAWADALLERIGLTRASAATRTLEDLHRVVLDLEHTTIIMAIRDALHPSSGQRQACFAGLRERGLQQIVKNRFAELKKEHEATLRQHQRGDWSDGLQYDILGCII